MKTILIDMDGVVVDFVEGLRQRLHLVLTPTQFAKLPNPSEQLHYYLDDCVDDLEVKQIIHNMVESDGFFATLPVMPGIFLGFNRLNVLAKQRNIELFFCTKPLPESRTCASDKLEWIERYFGTHWRKRVILTDDKTLCRGQMLIDDHPEPAGLLVPTWQHVVFDAGYNKNTIGHRMMNWSYESVQTLMDTCEL